MRSSWVFSAPGRSTTRADASSDPLRASIAEASSSYGMDAVDDVELGGARTERRGRGWRSALGLACVVGVAALAGACSTRSSGVDRSNAMTLAALGVQPDARGTPPPETTFLRKARRAFGAALMRASYHQSANAAPERTLAQAEAEADQEAMREIEDKEFEDDADGTESTETTEAVTPAPTPATPKRADPGGRAAKRRPAASMGSGFLSTRAKRQHERERERREEREKIEQKRVEEEATEDDRYEAVQTKESQAEAQKYFKSINGGYFGVDVKKETEEGEAPSDISNLHNKPGAIPGLIDHLRANGAQVGQMRAVTYTNSAYWPVAKLFIESAKKLPGFSSALTVMVTDRDTLKECVSMGVMCFLDQEMIEILGEHMNSDGSIHAGRKEMSGDLGKALRIVWTWRKVHVVHTLVSAGYGCLFVDASTVLLRDPRLLIKEKLDAGALLVTLSDFGGVLEQKAINTGLIAARPNEYIGKLLEYWMQLEPTATDTEQASLTWNIAPNARADGVIITALSQSVAPSYLTFDLEQHVTKEDTGKGPQHKGYLVHAAYCGSISGKIAFLKRVSHLASHPLSPMIASKEENEGCDVYDRHKFFTCGLAPWDGECE